MCEMAMRRIVSLSGLRASVLHVGTMSHSSLMYVDILLRRRRSISQWLSLTQSTTTAISRLKHHWKTQQLMATMPAELNLCFDFLPTYKQKNQRYKTGFQTVATEWFNHVHTKTNKTDDIYCTCFTTTCDQLDNYYVTTLLTGRFSVLSIH